MNLACGSRIEIDTDIGIEPRRAVAPSHPPTRQEALLTAADRIKRTLGEATAQLERLEGRFEIPAPSRPAAAATPVPAPQPVSRGTAGAVASAEARVQMALRGVLIALRDMGLPRTGAAAP